MVLITAWPGLQFYLGTFVSRSGAQEHHAFMYGSGRTSTSYLAIFPVNEIPAKKGLCRCSALFTNLSTLMARSCSTCSTRYADYAIQLHPPHERSRPSDEVAIGHVL